MNFELKKLLRTALRYLRIFGEYLFINERLIAENLIVLLRKINLRISALPPSRSPNYK